MNSLLSGANTQMNRRSVSQWSKTWAVLVGCCLSVSAIEATAFIKPISANFSPDAGNPQKNEFTNTTPNQGFCFQLPALCASNGIFSLRANLNIPRNGPIQPDDPDVRKGAMLKAPAAWRSITVINRDTRESATLDVRIAGIGGVYRLSDTPMELTGEPNLVKAHRVLWGTDWATAPAPCRALGSTTYAGHTGFYFFWMTPEEAVCAKPAKFPIPALGYESLDFSYQLRTPNPLTMSTGVYEGTVVYTVGPHGDFDLGDHIIPADPVLQLDFTLTVQHTLKVELPPGGDRVELLPQGGWQAWLQRNRRPERLFRDQTFNVSSSSRFKMQLECQYPDGGNTCALRDSASGHAVPLNIAVTLPAGMTEASGQPVSRRPLLLDGTGTELFVPGYYVDRKPGTLHFEVGREAVEEMLTGESKTYAGNVTVIWNSEV